MARSVNVIGTSVTVYPPWIARHARSIWKLSIRPGVDRNEVKLSGLHAAVSCMKTSGDVADLGPRARRA